MKKLLICFAFVLMSITLASVIVSCASKEASEPFYGPKPSETGNIKVGTTVKFTSTNVDKKGETLTWKVNNVSVGNGKILDYKFNTEGEVIVQLVIATASEARHSTNTYTVVKTATTNTTTTACFIGVWTRTEPGFAKASSLIIRADKTQTLSDWTSDGSLNRIIEYTWTESAGYLNIHYVSYKLDGTDVLPLPKDDHTPYTCSGSTLILGGVVTWHK